jgi:hypothetical protein
MMDGDVNMMVGRRCNLVITLVNNHGDDGVIGMIGDDVVMMW